MPTSDVRAALDLLRRADADLAGGFIRCETCGDQEETADMDVRALVTDAIRAIERSLTHAAKVRREALKEAARWVRLGRWHDPDACAEGIRALIQAAPQPGAQEAQGALAGRAGGEGNGKPVTDWRAVTADLTEKLYMRVCGPGIVDEVIAVLRKHTAPTGAAAPAPSAQPPAPHAATEEIAALLGRSTTDSREGAPGDAESYAAPAPSPSGEPVGAARVQSEEG